MSNPRDQLHPTSRRHALTDLAVHIAHQQVVQVRDWGVEQLLGVGEPSEGRHLLSVLGLRPRSRGGAPPPAVRWAKSGSALASSKASR
eukprot:2623225-Pyramimonas_sp.AAC.1